MVDVKYCLSLPLLALVLWSLVGGAYALEERSHVRVVLIFPGP